MAVQLTVPAGELAAAARRAAFRAGPAGSAGLAAGVERVIRMLPPEERRLAELLFVHGLSYRRAALVMDRPPGATRRGLLRLRRRLTDPYVHAVAAALDALDPDSRALAVELLILGHSERAIARARGLTRRAAQQHADAVRGWARTLVDLDPPDDLVDDESDDDFLDD